MEDLMTDLWHLEGRRGPRDASKKTAAQLSFAAKEMAYVTRIVESRTDTVESDTTIDTTPSLEIDMAPSQDFDIGDPSLEIDMAPSQDFDIGANNVLDTMQQEEPASAVEAAAATSGQVAKKMVNAKVNRYALCMGGVPVEKVEMVKGLLKVELQKWLEEARPPKVKGRDATGKLPVEVQQRIRATVDAQAGMTRLPAKGRPDVGSNELVQAKQDFRARIKSRFAKSYIGKTRRDHSAVQSEVRAVLQSAVGQKLSEAEVRQFTESAATYVTDSCQRKRGVHIPKIRKAGTCKHKRGMGVYAATATRRNVTQTQTSSVLPTRWTDPSPATRQNLPEVGTAGPREATFTTTIVGNSCSVTVKPELRRWTTRPTLLTPPAEQFLHGLDAAAVGKYYVGKTEGQKSSNLAAPWLSEAMQAIRAHMKRPEQQALIKACKPTQATPLQLQLSYARIASEEGVAAMEARAVELKRKKPGSQNSLSGLAAAGGEGWLYFWDVTDTRFP
jgi:hypothetical protein